MPPDWSGDAGHVPVTTQGASEARDLVLEKAGAWPHDQVTRAAAEETADRTGQWGRRFEDESQWLQGLTPVAPPTDSDGDGMPDDWESANGLNPALADDTTVLPSGYTAIEQYLNELAFAIVNGEIFADGFETGTASAWSQTSP